MKKVLLATLATFFALSSLTAAHADGCKGDDCAVDPQIVTGGY